MPFYGGIQSFLEAAPLKNKDLKTGIACCHKLPKILLLFELQICLLLLSYLLCVAALQLLCWTQDCMLFYCQLSIAETHLETKLQPAAAKTTGSHIGKKDTVPW